MIIAFSGVDCAGKSTHIELLRQYFISQGKTCTVFWYRPGYSQELQKIKSFIRPLAVLAKNPLVMKNRLTSDQSSTPENAQNRKADKEKVSIPAPLWLTSAIIDATLQYALKLRYLEKKYDVVICDRYVNDACLDLSFKYQRYAFSEDILRQISRIFPKPDHSILLWLPYDLMLERVERKNEPFPDPPHIRRLRWHAYQFMTEKEDISVVDVSGSIEESHQKIIDIIEK